MDAAVIFLFCLGISITANIGLAVAWLRTSRRLRHLEDRALGLGQPDVRADRLEQAVAALGSQVDQLASGQDFLNRVLTDRLDKLGRELPAHESRDAPR
jgi:hypothetical protein